MRIPISTEASDLVETLEAFGYHRLIDKMIWTWTGKGWHLKFDGARTKDGYLRVGIDRRAAEYMGHNFGENTAPNVFIHRLIYALHIGELPEGGINSPLTLDHLDDDKSNDYPTNLQVMTRPGNSEKARPYGIGFCNQHGHPLVGKNVRRHPDGHTICRYCDLERKRRRDYENGRTKQVTPMPEFHVWIIAQHATKEDLAMLANHGVPMPGAI